MKRVLIVLTWIAILMNSGVRAEFRQVDLSIFGMD